MLLSLPNPTPTGTVMHHSLHPSGDAQKENTRNPHGPLTIPCENCHTAAAWRPIRAVPEFDHNKTSYPLRGMHEKVKCVACHIKPVFTNVGKNCADCHADIHRRQMGSDCAQCHTVQGWNVAVQQVKDHQNRFPLLGAHAAVQCDECHKQLASGILYGLSTQCDSCHLKDWQSTTNPPHASAGPAFASANCQGCHNFDSWLGAKFDHSTTGFPLTAGHANVPCASCHVNNNYNLQISPTDCGNAGCHLTTWQQTNNPPHPQAGPTFAAANCSQCHNTTSWTNVTFNHSATGFPLTNSHATVPCASCHINNNYNLQIAPADCGNAGCHFSTWQQTNNPTHSSAGPAFAVANCSSCHDTVSWTDISAFNHATTGFALVGTHATTPCAQCHVNNNYNLTSTDCLSCHQSSWNSTQTLGGNVPNHVAANFPSTASACVSCHPITTWSAGTFDHSTTGFPLTNSHQLAPAGKVTACTQCHIGGNYTLNIQPTDCGNSGCHLTTWQQTNNPTHSSAGSAFAAANCSTCHDTITWTDNTFNHSVSGFTLTGAHTTTPCAQCHVNNNYNLTIQPTDCGNSSCHLTQWNSTQTLGGNVPNHVTAGFPMAQCSSCHDTTNWADSIFNHASTGFPLTGEHSAPPLQCAQCHTNSNYNLQIAATDCANSGCHQTDWQNTNNPVHSAAGTTFAAVNCSNCHTTANPFTTTSWTHTATGWALVGNHQMSPAGVVTNCHQCHVGNNYNLTVTDCYNSGCHTADWNSTATLGGAVPNHVAAQFPPSLCSSCHDTLSWADGKFDHSTTGWALTGGHVVPTAGGVQACTDCHVNNNYSLTAANTACYGCHVAQWNSTQTLGGSVPNHIAAGYPTTCDSCHTPSSWLGATFNHTYFPIPHHGSVCNDCHQVSTDYSSFTCINCHTTTAHQQTQTVNQHDGVSGFVYGPTTCYNCHKNGGGG
jgi:nitrate/TMAO reductase-like tetraheme cytochrome c subunit